MSSRQVVLLCVILFFLVGLVVVLGPLVRCIYKHHAFARNTQIQIEIPSCGNGTPTVPRSACRYLFSFEGEHDVQSIRFSGDDLRYNYDPGTTTFSTTGPGKVAHHETIIQVTASEILFNGQSLPVGQGPNRVLVKLDGEGVTGYCEPRW